MWSASSGSERRSSGRMPRTSAPGGAGFRGRHDLALDQRGDPGDPRDVADFLRGRIEIGEAAAAGIDPEIAVEAEDAAEQVGAEPVHHRHHDDQGGDAERDPEQRKDRDDRDEPFLPPRPQIAERDHPLERAEDHAACPSPPRKRGPRACPA